MSSAPSQIIHHLIGFNHALRQSNPALNHRAATRGYVLLRVRVRFFAFLLFFFFFFLSSILLISEYVLKSGMVFILILLPS